MRRWILVIVVLSMTGGLALTAFCGWLLNSTSGAVWLLETVSSVTGVEMTSGRVEGRLAEELLVDDLAIALPDGQVMIHKIRLDWEPLSALKGNLKIGLLQIDRFVVESYSLSNESDPKKLDGEESNEPGFSARDLRVLPGWLTVEIADLQFKGLILQDPEGSITVFDSLAGSFVASRQQLTSSAFAYHSPFVDFKGHFEWDLRTPHLEMSADVHLPEELIDHQLFEDIAVPVDFPGLLSLDGDWNGFSGPVSFGTETEALSSVWLAADVKGSWQGIHFENLKGHYLGGRLHGDLDLSWVDFYRMNGQILGAGLNPVLFQKDLDGLATLDVSGELFVPYDENPIKGHIGGKILEAQLHGANVSGDFSLDWQNDALHEVDMDLSSNGARLYARGKPSERLDIEASITDMSSFYADLSGQLSSSGWLRWSDGYLSGELSGTGSDVVWQETSLQSFHYQASHLQKQAPIEIVIDGRNLRYDTMQSDFLYAEVSGDLEQHNLLVTINDQTGQLTVKFAGGYREDVWRGQLSALDAETSALGSWSLEKPSTLEWKDGIFNLNDFVLNGERGGRVALEIAGLGESRNSSLALHWQDLRHDWLTYLKPGLPVPGKSTGHFNLEMADFKPTSIKALMTGNFRLKNDYSPLEIPLITLDMVWVDTGLDLDVNADTEGGEHLQIIAASSQPPDWRWPTEELFLTMHWQDVDLDRLSPFREGLKVQGRSDGSGKFEIQNGSLQMAKAEITADGQMQENTQPFGFRSLSANLLWDDKILESEVRIEGLHNGLLSFNITSAADPDLDWPSSGDVELLVNDFDLRSFTPFLPEEVDLAGHIGGEATGYWRDSGEVTFQGRLGVLDDGLVLQLPGGQVGDVFKQADLQWQWQGSQLDGQLEVLMASGGHLQGHWQVPFSAAWPLNFNTDGQITANLKGGAQLADLITVVAPDVFQDVRGRFASDLTMSGTLSSPRFSGTLDLTDAGAYLPMTGATIDDLLMHASLQDDEIHLEKLSLRAGEGSLLGTGLVEFNQWKLKSYNLVLKGERLHLYNFPELQVFCSPDLTLDGDLNGTRLTGTLLIPEMRLIDKSTGSQALPSKDVVIHGENHVDREKLTFDTDIQVLIELGDKVKVKTEGVEARLEGGVTIGRDEKQHLAGWGEIRLVDGVYKAYGTNLEIKQGVMSYDNDPLVNPKLKVFAAKDIGRVQAGVHITGTAENPVVTLASNPAMPERDILGYIFMGRPISKDSEGGDALTIGAGALMPNYGETFADYGIVELDLDGLLKDEGGVRLRKRLSESWEISSTLGTESGIDLYYLLDFD